MLAAKWLIFVAALMRDPGSVGTTIMIIIALASVTMLVLYWTSWRSPDGE